MALKNEIPALNPILISYKELKIHAQTFTYYLVQITWGNLI